MDKLTCTWIENAEHGGWDTECGDWQFIDDVSFGNDPVKDIEICINCGREIVVAKVNPLIDDLKRILEAMEEAKKISDGVYAGCDEEDGHAEADDQLLELVKALRHAKATDKEKDIIDDIIKVYNGTNKWYA